MAASAGLSEDERRELVQRAPSHGNLLDSSAAAAACAGWLLRSGRYCLLSVGHDGPEPSGRGGLRVVTHATVLTPALYRRFMDHPFRLSAALRPHVAATRPTAGTASLPQIPAPAEPAPLPGPAELPAEHELDAVLHLLGRVLEGCPTIVLSVAGPARLLGSVFDVMPAELRQACSFQYGLKPSSERQFKLLFLEKSPELSSFARDCGYTVLDLAAPAPWAPAQSSAWRAAVRTAWQSGDAEALRSMAARRA